MPTLTGENAMPSALALGDVSEAQIVEDPRPSWRDRALRRISIARRYARQHREGRGVDRSAWPHGRRRSGAGDPGTAPRGSAPRAGSRHHRPARPRDLLHRHRRSNRRHVYDRRSRKRGHGTSGRGNSASSLGKVSFRLRARDAQQSVLSGPSNCRGYSRSRERCSCQTSAGGLSDLAQLSNFSLAPPRARLSPIHPLTGTLQVIEPHEEVS